LGLELDDRLTLLVEGHDGSLFAEAFRVRGLFETGGQGLDGGFVYLRRDDARRLLAAEGDASEIVLRLADPLDAPALVGRLAALPTLREAQVRSWHETAPEVLSAMEMLRVMERLRNLVLFILVGLGILNAVVMSVFERRREFGVLLAMGLRPSAIVRLLVWEVGLLALLGIAVGVGSAWLVTHAWLGSRGLDVFALGARLPGALEGSSVIYPVVSWPNVLGASAWVGALALLVIVWPARSILRLDPADVLRGRG
jgi:ABC-type lipoprotein release transport system permease subunit